MPPLFIYEGPPLFMYEGITYTHGDTITVQTARGVPPVRATLHIEEGYAYALGGGLDGSCPNDRSLGVNGSWQLGLLRINLSEGSYMPILFDCDFFSLRLYKHAETSSSAPEFKPVTSKRDFIKL